MRTATLSLLTVVLMAIGISCKRETDIPIVLNLSIPDVTIAEEELISQLSISNATQGLILRKGICWSTTHDPRPDSSDKLESVSSIPEEAEEFLISGLNHNTVYYLRAYAVTSKGVSYSIEKSVRTKRKYLSPALNILEISNISVKTASIEASVTDDGGKIIMSRGVCFSEQTGTTLENGAKMEVSAGSGSYSCNLTGLKGGTKYFVKAFAINEVGVSYSDEISFTTEASSVPVPLVTTSGAAFVSMSAASLKGKVSKIAGSDILLKGVVWSTNSNEILTTSNTNKMFDNSNIDGDVTYRVTGLEPSTTYYYCLFAENAGGTGYGEKMSFKTDVTGAMVLVSKGTFLMGANSGDPGYLAAHGTAPKHNVVLSENYYISKYEVTSDEFVEFLNAVKARAVLRSGTSSTYDAVAPEAIEIYGGKVLYHFQSTVGIRYVNSKWESNIANKNKAVNAVTWVGASFYCKWRSEATGSVYRLPTEAEWEFAARGGNLSGGYIYPGSNLLSEVAVYGTSLANLSNPGSKLPNELGLYDMAGNVWEFMSDKASTTYFDEVKEGVTDPRGANLSGVVHYVRKGDCFSSATNSINFVLGARWATANSSSNEAQGLHNGNGFRIVKEL